MSDLRIRSEALPDAVFPQPFLPPVASAVGPGDDRDFAPLLAATARALTALFGAPVDVLPGRPAGEPGARIAPELAGLLATLRLGGDPARPQAVGGVALVRYARAIGEVLDSVAARVWPVASPLAGFDLDIACGPINGHAHVTAPPPLAAAPPGPRPCLADLPLRIRVEIAGDMASVASLLPLVAGSVLPITPVAEMPLIVGDHRIGRATVTPLPDGRQSASIVAVAVQAIGGAA